MTFAIICSPAPAISTSVVCKKLSQLYVKRLTLAISDERRSTLARFTMPCRPWRFHSCPPPRQLHSDVRSVTLGALANRSERVPAAQSRALTYLNSWLLSSEYRPSVADAKDARRVTPPFLPPARPFGSSPQGLRRCWAGHKSQSRVGGLLKGGQVC